MIVDSGKWNINSRTLQMKMHQVILSLAANCDAEKNLPEARLCLEQILAFTHYTDAVWTEPIGCKRKDLYLNQLVKAMTELSFDELRSQLKTIELKIGRTAEDRQEGIVRLDLDILAFDDERHHLADWERHYVKMLLPQL